MRHQKYTFHLVFHSVLRIPQSAVPIRFPSSSRHHTHARTVRRCYRLTLTRPVAAMQNEVWQGEGVEAKDEQTLARYSIFDSVLSLAGSD